MYRYWHMVSTVTDNNTDTSKSRQNLQQKINKILTVVKVPVEVNGIGIKNTAISIVIKAQNRFGPVQIVVVPEPEPEPLHGRVGSGS